MKVFSRVNCLFLTLAITAIVQAQNDNTDEPMLSTLASDEYIQFFRTAAIFIENENVWRIPIHGWVYEPQSSYFRKALFSQAIKTKYGLKVAEQNKHIYDRRLNLLIADNERNKIITIQLAGENYTLPKSAPNGHFSTELTVANDVIAKHRRGNIVDFNTSLEDGRQFSGQVQLLSEEGLSVISDIDDTIKVSQVLDHQALIDNTFLKEFTAVAGMSDAYQQLVNKDNQLSFHYVSSSPWQLYAPLEEFVDQENFPRATFSLRAIRFRDTTLFDLFKAGTETKPLQIESILNQFPRRRFLLIGDSGEQDPEVYSAIAAQFPERIVHIFIRNISNETIENARFSALVADPAQWTLFNDPIEIDFPN